MKHVLVLSHLLTTPRGRFAGRWRCRCRCQDVKDGSGCPSQSARSNNARQAMSLAAPRLLLLLLLLSSCCSRCALSSSSKQPHKKIILCMCVCVCKRMCDTHEGWHNLVATAGCRNGAGTAGCGQGSRGARAATKFTLKNGLYASIA